MAEITLKGTAIHTRGSLPAVGSKAPDFKLTRGDLNDVTLDSFRGKRKILNIVPSLDTGVCAESTRKFNMHAANLKDAVVLTISNDLPFAQQRFYEAEGLKNVTLLSQLRDREFGKNYQLEILDGPLAGLLSRCIVVLDAENRVLYSEQVPEIVQEPNYEAALQAVEG